ncbi:MAG: hypothetical protein QXE31_03745 [Candidatus Woesearchaeota archaeon]
MKFAIIITTIMLFIGTFFYFRYSPVMIDENFFKNLKMKVDFSEKNEMKVFSYVNEQELKKLKLNDGKISIENNKIVLGFNEAEMMKNEKLFSKIDDNINNFFGINVQIGGVLKKTNTMIDDMHFLSEENFYKINGIENKLFIKFTNKGMPKLFYSYSLGDKPNLELMEGNIKDYNVKIINGKTYYPVVIGFDEASMMISEKLFQKSGDKIDDFFGINVHVVGIINKTNSIIDMTHFIPLIESDLR